MDDGSPVGTHTSIARENINHGVLQANAPLTIHGDLSVYGKNPETDKKLFFQDLLITDPNLDKKRIEKAKGGLLQGSHNWILDDAGFKRWRDDRDVNLLWVHGGPGMGKTMLLCGILDELKGTIDTRADLVSFFFCENSNNDNNSATSVLRGLMYMLVDKNPWIVKLIQSDYDKAGAKLFEGRNSWYSVREVFLKVLHHLIGNSRASGGGSETRNQAVLYLAIDALDECATDLNNLLDLITQESSLFYSSASTAAPRYRIKWLVSSRMLPNISIRLGVGKTGMRHAIDLNKYSKDISRVVNAYVDRCANELESRVGIDRNARGLRQDICSVLRGEGTSNYNGVKTGRSRQPPTFLYVSLVFAKLKKVATSTELRTALGEVGSDVIGLYTQAADHIAYLPSKTKELCRNVLSAVTVAYRPLKRQELYFLSGLSFPPARDDGSTGQDTPNAGATQDEVLVACDTFLAIRAEDNTAYFVHQSAKDFLCSDHRSVMFLFDTGTHTDGQGGGTTKNRLGHEHYRIFLTSIQVLNGTLKRNTYGLIDRACSIDQIEVPRPDPLAAISYSATYWIDHLLASGHHGPETQDDGLLSQFIKTKLLYWLECLALVRGIRQALISWAKLADFIQGKPNAAQLTQQVLDAHRFIAYHNRTIMTYPLQAYESALVFSPPSSQTRASFWVEEPNWVTVSSTIEEEGEGGWSPFVQTLDLDLEVLSSGGRFKPLQFSPDNSLLAASNYQFPAESPPELDDRDDPIEIIKIFDVATGLCLRTLHDTASDWMGFPPANSTLLAIAGRGKIQFFDMARDCWTGRVLSIGNASAWQKALATFSSDGVWLAVVMGDDGENSIGIWDWARGDRASQLKRQNTTAVRSLAFSPCGTRLAAAHHQEICIWNPESGTCERVLSLEASYCELLVGFSPDGRKLISVNNKTLEAWNPDTGKCLQRLDILDEGLAEIALSPDSSLAAVAKESFIKVWDVSTRRRLQTVRSYERYVHSIAFSIDGTWLACAGAGGISICRGRPFISGNKDEILNNREFGPLRDHDKEIKFVRISANNRMMVSCSNDAIKIWSLLDGRYLGRIETPSHLRNGFLADAAISPDGTKLAVTYITLSPTNGPEGIQIWDLETIENTTIEAHPSQTIKEFTDAICFPSGIHRVVAFMDSRGAVRIWNLASKSYLEEPLRLRSSPEKVFAISPKDSRRVAVSCPSGNWRNIIKISNPGQPGCYPPSVQELLDDHEGGITETKAIYFSSNGNFLAVLKDEPTDGGNGSGNCVVKIWKLNTNSRRNKSPLRVHRTLNITTSSVDNFPQVIGGGISTRIIAFETSSPTGGQGRLLTNVGLFTFDLDTTGTEEPKRRSLAPGQEKQNPHLHVLDAAPCIIKSTGYGIDVQGGWITYNSERVLFLPEEYRPSSMDAVCVAGRPTTGAGEVMDPCMLILGCRSGKVVILRFPEAPGPLGGKKPVFTQDFEVRT